MIEQTLIGSVAMTTIAITTMYVARQYFRFLLKKETMKELMKHKGGD
jgi:hypothetical protein